MNFFDTVMSGRVSAQDLAGVAIGSSIWVPIFTGINGVLLALTPIVAHLSGAKKDLHTIGKKVQQAIYLSIVIASCILIIGTFVLEPILNAMDLETEVRKIAKYYLVSLATGIVPLFIFNSIRRRSFIF